MKRIIHKLGTFGLVLTMLLTLYVPAFADSSCFPAYTGSSTSLSDALEECSSGYGTYSYREEIAEANGITDYSGSVNQNTYLYDLYCQGLLKRPYNGEYESERQTGQVFPKYNGNSTSISDALASLGIENSFTYRQRIAEANGVCLYEGTVQDNVYLLSLLKDGRLLKPENASSRVSTVASPISTDLSIREVFGYSGKIFLVDRDKISVRAEPYVTGDVLYTIERGTPVLALGLFTNSKGNNWLKIQDKDGSTSWVFSRYVKEHATHNLISLDDYGFSDYKMCTECGHVVYTGERTEDGGIQLSASDEARLALAVLSFVPVLGEPADLADMVLSLREGDTVGFIFDLVALLPLVGLAADGIHGGKTITKIIGAADDTAVTLRVLKETDMVEVVGDLDRNQLKKAMRIMYERTRDKRFLLDEGYVAHHIVEFSDKSEASAAARSILENYDIGLNSAHNGVALCSNPAVCFDGGALHTGRHVKSYSETVLQRLEEALDKTSGKTLQEQRNALIEALDGLARDLQRNDLQLQKSIQKAA